jgi:hypothetical protein
LGEGEGGAARPVWAQMGARGGASGSDGAKKMGEEGGGERGKDFPFFNIYFLDECIYIFKQSKKCMVQHGASSKIKYFRVLLYM